MAGSITTTIAQYRDTFVKTTVTWVCDASGAVSGNSLSLAGTLVKVSFKPDAGGTQPSDLYDMTIADEAGVDILGGQGANLSNATATSICPGVPMKDGVTTSTTPGIIFGTITPSITNAGNAKGGTIIFYTR